MSYFQPVKYVKNESFDPIYKQINPRFFVISRLVPVVVPTLGILLLGTQVIIPLISFKTLDEVAKPVYSTALARATGFSEFEFEELDKNFESAYNEPLPNSQPNTLTQTIVGGLVSKPKKDITQASEIAQSRVLGKSTYRTDEIPKYFYLTIPKLGIKNALVESNSPTLQPDEALGHYTNSAPPGSAGNTFIYGHSVLPFFYNPKNYKTIFSTLPQLEVGDLIYITYNDKELKYKVENKRELSPKEVNPLGLFRPAYLNESTLTLMTCSPPGLKTYRLLVDAVLI